MCPNPGIRDQEEEDVRGDLYGSCFDEDDDLTDDEDDEDDEDEEED